MPLYAEWAMAQRCPICGKPPSSIINEVEQGPPTARLAHFDPRDGEHSWLVEIPHPFL